MLIPIGIKGLIMKVGAFLLRKFSLETCPKFHPTLSGRGGGSGVLESQGLLIIERYPSQQSQGDSPL